MKMRGWDAVGFFAFCLLMAGMFVLGMWAIAELMVVLLKRWT